MATSITLGVNDEERRLAALRQLAEASGAIGRNGGASISELNARLADAAEVNLPLVAEHVSRAMSVDAPRAIPDVERAAIGALRAHVEKCGVWSPTMRAWCVAIGTDPNEHRQLVEFAAAAGGFERGFSADPWGDWDAYLDRFNGHRATVRLALYDDGSIMRLAEAIVRYRREGRPVGDVVYRPLQYGGDDEMGMSLVTSLAAVIGEYVAAMLSGERPPLTEI